MNGSVKLALAIVFSICIVSISVLFFSASAETSLEKSMLNDDTIRIQTALKTPLMDIQLIENTDHCLSNCHAILKITPYQDITLPQETNSEFKWNFVKEKDWMNGLESYHFEILTQTEHTIEVPDYGTSLVDSICYDENNETYECQKEEIIQTGTHKETKYRYDYKPFAFWGETLKANQAYKIKLFGKENFEFGKENSIDWIPTIKGLELSEWAWWNASSCTERWEIISDAAISNLPINVNGTNFPNYWTTNATSESYPIYLYKCGNYYFIANETDEMNWENGTSRAGNNTNDVWESALRGVWHLDEGSGTDVFDSTSNSNDGTSAGSPVYTDNGVFGDALIFDGSDDVVTIGDVGINFEEFTAMAWVNVTELNDEGNIIGSNSISWGLAIGSTNYFGAFIDDDGAWPPDLLILTGTNNFTANTLHHVAMVYSKSGSLLTLYKNGVEVSSGSVAVSPHTTTDIRIGDSVAFTKRHEVIDEARIYNRTLSATEIQEIYWNGINNLTILGTVENEEIKPYFSDYKKNIDSPNEDQDVTINVTITEIPSTIDTVILEFDNGTKTNYTVTTSNNFEYYFTISSTGNYTAHDTINYEWFANDTFNNANWSVQQNFTIANQPPSAPTLTYPENNTGVALGATIPEFNWSVPTDDDAEDTFTYDFEIYYQNGTPYNQTTLPNNYTTTTLPTGFDQTYHWRVRANDSYDVGEWSDNWTFQYANWTITFNLTDSFTGEQIDTSPPNKKIYSISCDDVMDVVDVDNPYTYNFFPPGIHECTFVMYDTYLIEKQNITADGDKVITIPMSEEGGLTVEEHNWLEWLYTCWNSGTCNDLLNEINLTTNEMSETVDSVWNHVKRTDQSVVTQEVIINKTVDENSNLTINYTINVPIKEGYTFGDTSGEVRLDYLPIRISYWFLDESDNKTCYSQGNYSVATAEPYCQPLTVYTIGQVNSTLDFVVDLRPSVPSGTYTIVRNIEIDPEQVWINYGREAIGTIEVTEGNEEATVSLENTGTFPEKTVIYDEPVNANGITETTPVTGSITADVPELTSILSLALSILAIGLLGYFYVSSKKRY